MPFTDSKEGQTHYYGDNCGIKEHNDMTKLTKSKEEYYTTVGEEIVRISVNTEIKNPVIQLDINTLIWKSPENYVKFLAKISEIITKKFNGNNSKTM